MERCAMRIARMATALALLLVLTGCEPAKSLHGIWTEDSTVFEPRLVGTWIHRYDESQPDLTLRFTKASEKAYRVDLYSTRPDEELKAMKNWSLTLDGHLIRLGDKPFLDLYPEEVAFKGDSVMTLAGGAIFLQPVHTFYRVEMEGGTLRLSYLDDASVKQMIREDKIRIAHDLAVGGLLLTADTPSLRQFLLEHAKEDTTFPPIDFQRGK